MKSAITLLLSLALVHQAMGSTNCVKLLTAGDWGTTSFGTELKSWMNRVASSAENQAGCAAPAAGLLLLGDNFYDWGVSSTTDSKWNELYESQFDLPNLQAIPEHWATAGNHDHYNVLAGTSAQKQYTTAKPAGSKWTFPSDYYIKQINQNGIKIFLLFTESWNLVGGDSWLPFQSARMDEDQLRWIEANLASTAAQTADWLIVVGHYPVRSVYTSFGRGDTTGLVRRLEPLLKKYSVDAYISGHDHFHVVIDRRDLGYPVYYTNGASGKRDSKDINYGRSGLNFVVENSLGFQSMVFTKTQLITTVHYKLPDGVERTHTFVQTQNKGPSTPFDCEQFSCGATCAQYKEYGCSWSSTASPPKFSGPGGKGTCVLNWDKDTSFWEKNDGVCTQQALLEAEVLETDEAMLDRALSPGQIAGTVLGTLGAVALITTLAVTYRRRSHIKAEIQRLSSRLSSRLSRRSLTRANGVADGNIVATSFKTSENPAFEGQNSVDIKV